MGFLGAAIIPIINNRNNEIGHRWMGIRGTGGSDFVQGHSTGAK